MAERAAVEFNGLALSILETLPGIERDTCGKPVLPLDSPSLYSFGHLIRLTEQLLLDLFSRGLLSGTTHTCLGQELCQMAVVRALDHSQDVVLSNHRNHGHFLTYSGMFVGLVAEVLGRERGVCRGIGGSQHLVYRHFHSNGVQAGMTAIGAGMALARKLRQGEGIVACMVGDGTLGEGLLYESLNLASVWDAPMLFVVEQNAIAQTTPTSTTTGGSIVDRGAAFGLTTWSVDDADPECLAEVDEIVRTVRSTRRPGYLVIRAERLGPHSKGDDLRGPEEMERIRSRDPLSRLGDSLMPAFRAVIEQRNQHFLDVVRETATASPESRFAEPPLHVFGAAAPFDPARHRRRSVPERTNVRASLNGSLGEMLADRSDVILLGEDLHDPYGGAFKVTSGLSTRFPDRVISTPISEAGIVGAGIGLALAGYRPIVEIMFADFISLAMDQIYNHAGKFPGMFDGVTVPLVIRTPSGGRRGYGPTHSQSPETLVSAVPGLTVVFGSHRHDSGDLIRTATLDWPYPVVFFEHKLLYAETEDGGQYLEVPPSASDPAASLFPTLTRRPIGEPDLTLVTYGGMLPVVEHVAEALENEDFAVEIVTPSLLHPLPRQTLLSILRTRSRIAVIEEAPVDRGFGADLAATLLEGGYQGQFRRIGAVPVPIPAARSLEAQVLPDERSVLERLLAMLAA